MAGSPTSLPVGAHDTDGMDLGLRGRTAIVCGASSGMGLAIAEALAAEGANVAMFARRRDLLEQEAERLGALPVRGDLTNPKDLERLVETTVEAFGGIDILVNNGGGPPRTPAVELTDDALEGAVELLLLSAVRLTNLCLPHLRENGHGRIVNITSSSVREPIDNLALSNSVRPGVIGWAKTLAREVGPDRDHGQLDRAGPHRDRPAGRGLRQPLAGGGPRHDPASPLRPAGRGRRRRLLPRVRPCLLRHRHRDRRRRRTDALAPVAAPILSE